MCVMAVDEALDTGAVYRRAEVPIGPTTTADELRRELVELGAALLVEAVTGGLGRPEPQVGEPTYAEKLSSDDHELAWDRPADELDRVVRVGGAWTTFRGRRLKVWAATVVAAAADGTPPALEPGQLDGLDVGTGRGRLRLVEVQPEGKARQRATDWRNGARPTADERLGS